MAEAGDAMRDVLEQAIHARLNATSSGHEVWECKGLAVALLPFVIGNMRRYAALHLRAAAEDVDDGEFSDRWSAAARASILARADALDPR